MPFFTDLIRGSAVFFFFFFLSLLHFKWDQLSNTPVFLYCSKHCLDILMGKTVLQQNSAQIHPICLRGSRDKQRAQCVYFANIAP